MPPRGTAAANAASSAQTQQDAILDAEGIEAYELPKALVTRIAKSGLPPSARFSHDTIIALNRGATVFINYLCASAQDVAHSKSHKTVAATDVLKALEVIEFADIMQIAQKELEVFRQEQKPGGKGKTKANADTPPVGTTTPTAPAPAPPASTPYDVPIGGMKDYPTRPPPVQTLPPPPIQHTTMMNPYYINPYAPRPASNLKPYTVTSGPYRPAGAPLPLTLPAAATTSAMVRKAETPERPSSTGTGVFEDPLPPKSTSGPGPSSQS